MLPNKDGARAERAPFLLGKRGVGRWPVQMTIDQPELFGSVLLIPGLSAWLMSDASRGLAALHQQSPRRFRSRRGTS